MPVTVFCLIKTKIAFSAICKSQSALKDRVAVSKVRLVGFNTHKKIPSPSFTWVVYKEDWLSKAGVQNCADSEQTMKGLFFRLAVLLALGVFFAMAKPSPPPPPPPTEGKTDK